MSARHLSESLATTELTYGSSSIELANELIKFAEVCAAGQQTDLARSSADRALRIFNLNYGEDSSSADDVRKLIGQLSIDDDSKK